METCGTDWLCSIITDILQVESIVSIHFSKIIIYLVLASGFFLAGRGSLNTLKGAYREGFINGIQYYVNVDAFNEARIPHKIDEDADQCIKEAKARVAKHIRPVPPPECC